MAKLTSMSINRHRRFLAAVTSSPCLELMQVNSTNIAALRDMWVRTFDPLLNRNSCSATKPRVKRKNQLVDRYYISLKY